MTSIDTFDPVLFRRNYDKFPETELQKYQGRHVAWSLDGTRILADGATREELYEQLKTLQIDPCQAVDDFIPDPNVSYI